MQKFTKTIFYTILILYIIFFLYHAIIYILYPYDIDNEEGFVLNQAKQIAAGNTIYPALKSYPYTVGNYTPLFQLLCVPFIWLFGVHHAIGRTISVLSTLGISAFVFLFVKKLTNDKESAFISATFPLCTHYVYCWSVYNRVDMLAIFFSFLGLYFVFQINKKETLAPIFFFVLSFYTKPNMIAGPLAVTAVYLLKKDFKTAFRFFACFLLTILSIFAVINYYTKNLFFKHVILYNLNPFSWHTVWLYANNFFRFYPIFLAFVLFSLSSDLLNKNINLFVFYFIFSALVAVGCGKIGSAVNYLLEFIYAGSILFGIAITKIKPKFEGNYSIFINFLLIIQLLLIYHVPHRFEYGETPTKRDKLTADKVLELVKKTPGCVLSDDASLLLLSNKPVLFQPFIMSELSREGKWDASQFISDLQTGKFSLIILYFNLYENPDYERYTEKMIFAMREKYQLVGRIGRYWLYIPKP